MAFALALGTVVLLPARAYAILCDDVALPNKVYGAGGSAITATLKRVSLAIAKDPNKTDERTTIFYHDDLGACPGYQAFLDGEITGQFRYWIDGVENNADQRCDARPGGQPLDFAHMGNDATFCPQGTLPDGFGDFTAAVQTINVITHFSSNELSISAEALYLIYGFGPEGQAAPWTDGTGVFRRQFDSFAAAFLYGAIGIPPLSAKWEANEKTTQSAVITGITGYAGTSEVLGSQTLGYVSESAADARRADVKTLAYQHYDQECGVYPDSAPTAFDKVNVRLGKYFLWTPGHFYAPVDEDGVPLDERVANLFGWFTGKTQAPGTEANVFEESIRAGDIPQCAMQATREGTLGAISSYADPKPCSCYFEYVAGGASACTTCNTDADCGGDTPACNFGFCEAYRAEGEVEG